MAGQNLDGGSKIDKLGAVMPLWGIPWMEILEPVNPHISCFP